MKHGKRPTRRQKDVITSKGLNHAEWLVVKDCSEVFEIVHRESKEIRTFER